MDQDGSQLSPLAVEDHGSVQMWRMQLAPVNAINAQLLDALEAALDAAGADDSVAAITLTSGLSVFSAGADATWMAASSSVSAPRGFLKSSTGRWIGFV